MLACEYGSIEADLAVKLTSVHLRNWENFKKDTIYSGMCSKYYCRIRFLYLVSEKGQVHVHGHLTLDGQRSALARHFVRHQ